uniref:Secreted protein n=1 Tax=Plectus sambesii TaxID=2011161 RepID=A0A914W5P1_9BILA
MTAHWTSIRLVIGVLMGLWVGEKESTGMTRFIFWTVTKLLTAPRPLADHGDGLRVPLDRLIHPGSVTHKGAALKRLLPGDPSTSQTMIVHHTLLLPTSLTRTIVLGRSKNFRLNINILAYEGKVLRLQLKDRVSPPRRPLRLLVCRKPIRVPIKLIMN